MKNRWPASLDCVSPICNHIIDQLTTLGIDSTKKLKLKLALEEVLVNIVNHAYKGSPGNKIVLDCDLSADKISIRIVDSGPPFNPLTTEKPDTATSLSAREIGGLGIFLTKQMADGLEYRRVGHQNCLTMIFKRQP